MGVLVVGKGLARPKFIFKNHNLFDFLDVFYEWERVGKLYKVLV